MDRQRWAGKVGEVDEDGREEEEDEDEESGGRRRS